MVNNINFEYCIDHRFDTTFNCEEYGCNEEGICRCSRIVNFNMDRVDMSKLSNDVYDLIYPRKYDKKHKREEYLSELLQGQKYIDLYCIDRIASSYKLYDINKYQEQIEGGYYGDEFHGIFLNGSTNSYMAYNDDQTTSPLEQDFIEACKLVLDSGNLGNRLRYLLLLEYGNVLKYLECAEFKLIDITFNDLDMDKLNQSHIEYIRSLGTLDYYSPDVYDRPRGIVRKSGDKYAVIDGYHRMVNAGDKPFKVFCVK